MGGARSGFHSGSSAFKKDPQALDQWFKFGDLGLKLWKLVVLGLDPGDAILGLLQEAGKLRMPLAEG
jgi:hypothetical protein